MKAIVALVIVAAIGLIVYAKTRLPEVLHAKPTDEKFNAFATSEAAQVWDRYRGRSARLHIAKGPIDARELRYLEQDKADVDKLSKAGEIVLIDPKTNLKFVDFFATDTSRTLRWKLTKATRFSFENTQYFIQVRLPNGRTYFMQNWAIREPRPHLPGEPVF